MDRARAAGRRRSDVRGRQSRLDPAAADRRTSSPSSARSSLPINARDLLRAARPADLGDGAEPGASTAKATTSSTASRTASRSTSAGSRRSTTRRSWAASPRPKPSFEAKSAGNAAIGDPWSDIARAIAAYRELYLAVPLHPADRRLFAYAHTAGPRGRRARPSPTRERLPGYTDSRAAAARKAAARSAADRSPGSTSSSSNGSLSKAREYLGADDPDTKLLLGKESPEGAGRAGWSPARRLADPAVRKALWDGGKAAIDASTDPMIVYARRLDARDRAAPEAVDERIDGPGDRGPGQARRRPLRGLWRHRLSRRHLHPAHQLRQGRRAGPSAAGTVPPGPLLGGTFDRATGADPFDLPRGLRRQPQPQIDPNTVYDFVTTNDIIGGNSGSPVIDRAGRGDRRRVRRQHPQPRAAITATTARSIATVVVSTDAIQEALEKIYPAPALVAELEARSVGH